MSEPEPEPVEEIEEEKARLYVADPEDYQKTKKLEAIHEARKTVQETRRNRIDDHERYDEFKEDWREVYKTNLASRIAYYGEELLPLIEEGLEKGILSEEDLKVDMPGQEKSADVTTFIRFEGRTGEEIYHPVELNAFFQQFDRIRRKLGLGLNVEENKGPAEV